MDFQWDPTLESPHEVVRHAIIPLTKHKRSSYVQVPFLGNGMESGNGL